jgi:hypothetical protein
LFELLPALLIPGPFTPLNLSHSLAKVRVSETGATLQTLLRRRAMIKIELSDGKESIAYGSLEEAIKAAAEWYDYLAADGGSLIGPDFPRLDTEGIIDINGLNKAIRNWEEQLAVAIGFSSFNDHDGCYFRAADEAGFRLAAREIGIQWRRPLSSRTLNASTDLL